MKMAGSVSVSPSGGRAGGRFSILSRDPRARARVSNATYSRSTTKRPQYKQKPKAHHRCCATEQDAKVDLFRRLFVQHDLYLLSLRPCLEAENFEYSNRLAYPFKCTGRRPECFISGGRKNEYAPFCIPSSPAIIFCLSVVSHFLKLRGLPPRIKVDSLCVVAIAIKFLLNIIETNTPVGGLPFLNR